MRLLFWFSLATVIYAYVGYALLLAIVSRLKSRPVHAAPLTPPVSIVIAAHNEELNLPRKLRNLYDLAYPREAVEIIVASDGSTDSTNAILQEQSKHLKAIILPTPGGKAVALNAAVSQATGEILVFMDVRQAVDSDVLTELVSRFADPSVGAVSGELLLETETGDPSPDALGLYWKIEKFVRKLESNTGSVVGVTGALFAMRRELYIPLPPGTLLDDVLTPMRVARAGKRVLFLPSAIARDRIFVKASKEFGRKVRTLTGNYQLLQLAPWLLSWRNPLLFRLVSHKLLRLVVPLFLLLLLISSASLPGPLYRIALVIQVLVYAAALVGSVSARSRQMKFVSVAYTFAMLNAAAVAAFYNFVTGRARWA